MARFTITLGQAQAIAEMIHFDFRKFDFDQFRIGLEVELEHAKTVHGDLLTVGKIVVDHLREHGHYYDHLIAMENRMRAGKRP